MGVAEDLSAFVNQADALPSGAPEGEIRRSQCLAAGASIADASACGSCSPSYRMPAMNTVGTERTPLHFRAGGVDRGITIRPGERRAIVFRLAKRGPWRLVFRTPIRGFLSDGRAISVQSAAPVLRRAT